MGGTKRIPEWACLVAVLLAPAISAAMEEPPAARGSDSLLFSDEFENGLGLWRFPQGQGYELVDTGDPMHGHALALCNVAQQTHALVRGSDAWDGVRIEGDVLFPDDVDNYLGFIYRYVDTGRRVDFGSLYIKGNGSYVQANPHQDMNVGRTLYPERRASLSGRAAITIGEWQRFALEVVDNEAQLYVGSSEAPQLTLRSPEAARGSFGFKPRYPGGAAWIDNIRVRSIAAFSHTGPPRPAIAYARGDFVTDWEVLGPLAETSAAIESRHPASTQAVDDDGRRVAWQPFQADYRGAVLTGRVSEYRRSRRVAYFRTVLTGAPLPGPGAGAPPAEAELLFSTTDALAIWLNGEFIGFAPAAAAAWWDSGENPQHAPATAAVRLRPGPNHLLIRTIGGTYTSGGFYLRIARPDAGS